MKKLGLLLIILLFSSAVAAVEKPEWRIGMYWKYQVTPAGYNFTVEITGRENITVDIDNKNYEVWNLTQTTEGKTIVEKMYTYVRVDDLADVMQITYLKNKQKMKDIYSPPIPFIRYGVSVGDKWNASYQLLSYDGKKWQITVVKENCECESKEKIKIPIGEFLCYKIVKNMSYKMENSNRYFNSTQVIYYSPKLKNWIKSESYVLGNKKSEVVLIETNCLEKEKKFALPLYLVIIAFAIVGIISKTKK